MLIGIDASRAAIRERTGTENYAYSLTRALQRLAVGHRFRLYLDRAPPPELIDGDAQVECRVIPFPRLWTHVRLAWEVARHPPDVLYVPAHVIPLVHPRRCVATVHDLGYLRYPETHTPKARWYLDWSTRHSARAARRVIADSRATRDDLVGHYGIAADKVVVAYPAAAEGLREVTDPEALAAVRARYGTGERYLLYLGSLHPRKNLGALVQAFSLLCRSGALDADVNLVLAGKAGWLYDEVLDQVRERSVQGRVILPGYVPMEDLPALLSGARAFVFPSLYEGFGLPVLEAMGSGSPVCCSHASSLPEVGGDAALFFDPSDTESITSTLRQALTDKALASAMRQKGLARAAQFSWRRTATETLDLYERVIAHHRAR